MMSFTEHTYKAADGLDLYYREYAGSNDRLPIICLSGLTRNSADFHDFACRYSGTRTIYALDYRGRGKSQYDPDYSHYDPQTYISDIFLFLMAKDIKSAIFVGTSLGGLLTMGLAGLAPDYVSAVVLNDIGPEVNPAGGDRIADYVGNDVRYSSLEDAAAAQKTHYSNAYPDLDDDGWMKTTKTGYIWDDSQENYRLNYDLTLSKALKAQVDGEHNIDLWALFEALKDKPTFAIRGARSDVLSTEVFAKMQTLHPSMETLILQNRGHVPLLDEPLLLEKMDQFLEQL